jgi:hypothetical protein
MKAPPLASRMQGGGDIEGSARPAKAEGLVEAGGNVIARKQPHLYYTPPCNRRNVTAA